MVDKPTILTGSLIKKLCLRCSGRTTEICEEIYKLFAFTSNSIESDPITIIVVVNNDRIISMYFDLLKLRLEKYLHELEFNRVNGFIKDKISNCKVKFITMNNPDQFRGIKIKEIYFDTPELDIFKNEFIFNALASIK